MLFHQTAICDENVRVVEPDRLEEYQVVPLEELPLRLPVQLVGIRSQHELVAEKDAVDGT